MASKMAWAGLLGAAADIGQSWQNRQDAFALQKLQTEQELRREEARMARQMALEKWKFQESDLRESRTRVLDEESDKKKFEREHAGRMELEKERRKGDKPSEFSEKLNAIRGDEELTPEEKKKAIKALYKIDGGGSSEYDRKVSAAEEDESLTPEEKKQIKYGIKPKGGDLTEYQTIRAQEKIAEMEATGIDETNIDAYNRLASSLGIPTKKKVLKEAANDGGWFGKAKPDVYEFVTEETGAGIASLEDELPQPQSSGINKYKALLSPSSQNSGIIGVDQKAAPAQEEQPVISPQERKQLQSMSLSQLQAVKQGILDSGAKTLEAQDILTEIQSLIQKKMQRTQ